MRRASSARPRRSYHRCVRRLRPRSCDAMLGHLDEGRVKHRRAQAILVDLGFKLNIGGMSLFTAGLESMTGDLAAAERVFREGIAVLGSLGEKGYLSTQFGTLAQVLFEQGRFDEAENLARLSEDVGASDDVATQALWRQVRAKLLARRVGSRMPSPWQRRRSRSRRERTTGIRPRGPWSISARSTGWPDGPMMLRERSAMHSPSSSGKGQSSSGSECARSWPPSKQTSGARSRPFVRS